MGGISIWQLLIILAIVLVLFGAKRLRTVGTDLGAAVKGFRGAMKDGEQEDDETKQAGGHLEGGEPDKHTFEGEARSSDDAGRGASDRS
ncbi:MAG: Sec-independent protein translocase subunit TatA [Halofilum sp. (in: g-proteobacteria)]